MWKNIRKRLEFPESYISITLGFLVVLVAGILIYNYFAKGQVTQTAEQKAAQEQMADQAPKELPAKHVVKATENLWKIAVEYYGSGYNWVSIAKANERLATNPDYLEAGWEVTIPKAEVIKPGQAIAATDTVQPKEYTVVKGDNLWKIAERETGSGYNWTKIAQENNLADANLIFAGNVLMIPR